MKKQYLLLSAMIVSMNAIYADNSMNIGQNGAGIEKQIIPIQRFHTEKMNAGPNQLIHGQWISVQVNSAQDITITPKRGRSLKLISSRPVDPLKKDGALLYVFEAATDGLTTITLQNGAVYHFNIATPTEQNNGFVSGVGTPTAN